MVGFKNLRIVMAFVR